MDLAGSVVLVTGGAGLIGSHTVDRLLREDVERVIVFDQVINEANLRDARCSARVQVVHGDIFNTRDVKAAAKGADFVVHLAAMLLRTSAKRPSASLKTNILGTYRLLETIGASQPKKFVFGSSIAIYGSSPDPVVMSEDYPFNNRTIYGASKIAGEQFCRIFHDMAGLKYVSLRYSSAYGPRQHREGVYPHLIVTALDRIDAGLSPQIEGAGTAVQDFIYIEDVAEANILALKSDVDDEAFNIGSGTPTTERELIQKIVDLTKPGLEIEYLPGCSGEYSPSRWLSVGKARTLLKFEATTDLQSGLQQLIDWKRAESSR